MARRRSESTTGKKQEQSWREVDRLWYKIHMGAYKISRSFVWILKNNQPSVLRTKWHATTELRPVMTIVFSSSSFIQRWPLHTLPCSFRIHMRNQKYFMSPSLCRKILSCELVIVADKVEHSLHPELEQTVPIQTLHSRHQSLRDPDVAHPIRTPRSARSRACRDNSSGFWKSNQPSVLRTKWHATTEPRPVMTIVFLPLSSSTMTMTIAYGHHDHHDHGIWSPWPLHTLLRSIRRHMRNQEKFLVSAEKYCRASLSCVIKNTMKMMKSMSSSFMY